MRLSSLNARLSVSASAFRQRGAAVAEYLPPLVFGIILTTAAWAKYGDVVRTQMGHAADRFAENYYHGWFWPPGPVGVPMQWGAPANGTPAGEGPDTPPTGTGADSSGNGDPIAGTPGTAPDPSTGGGNSPPAPDGGAGTGLGNNLTDPSGAGGSPQMCTATTGSNNANPFSPTTPAPMSSPVASNASTFSFVANPIDIGTGNKFETDADYTGRGSDALRFERIYNSVLAGQDHGLGAGWRHSYQRSIMWDEPQHTATVWRDDGTQYTFPIQDGHGLAPTGVVDRLDRTDSGWTYITGDRNREHYDASGRLRRIDYASGQTHTFTYNRVDQLTQITDTRGATLTLNWRGQHLNAIDLPNHQRIDYTYDDRMNLHSTTRSNGLFNRLLAGFKTPERRYHYENTNYPHALTGLDDATGARFATWGYDNAGRANLSQHGDGAEKVTIDYRGQSADGLRHVAITNAAGLTAVYTLEPAAGSKYRLRDIDGQPTLGCAAVQNHHRYDANGFLHAQFNADHIGATYTRNSHGLIESEQHGLRFDANETPYAVDGATQTQRQWDKDQRWVVRETHASWQRDRQHPQGYWQTITRRDFTRDDRGRVLTDILTDLTEQAIPYQTHGTQRTRSYHYTFANAVQTQIKTMTVVDGNQHSTIYHYQDERLQRITNALNQTTEFKRYNANGQPEELRLPNGQTLRITYNDQDLPMRLERINQQEQEITTADYDVAGRLLHLTRPDGSEQHYTYNAAGQPAQLKNNWGETLTLTPNALTGQWEQRQISDAADNVTQRQSRRFNALGQLAAVLGNAGQQTTLAYNASGDLITTSERDQNPAHADIAHTTQAIYDTQHRLLEMVDAAGYRTHYDYSASGHTEAVTDANRNTTEYIRNGFGDIIKQSSPTTGSVVKLYDANGNLIENQNPSGSGIQFHYDALNRLTTIDYPGEQNDIRYTYDQTDTEHGNGVQQLTHIDTPTQTIDYRYDGLGHKIQETANDKDSTDKITSSTTLKYDYLAGNRLSQITYPDGSRVQYHYNKDRIEQVTYTDKTDSTKTIIKDIAYAPLGGPISWTYGNGLKQTKQLDQDGRVTDIALSKTTFNASQLLWSQHYAYDLYQNIEQIQRQAAPAEPAEKRAEQGITNIAIQNQRFAYDAMNRLTQEITDSSHKQYDYDALGNRTQEMSDTTPRSFTYRNGNQLQSSGAAKVIMVGGNTLIEKAPDALRFTYYDRHNRTRAIYKNKQLTATYGYDARGWRTRKATRGPGTTPITQQFAYATDGRLLSESTPDHRKNYVWLGTTPIAQIEAAANDETIIYLHADHLDTPRVASNDQDKIVWTWQGGAFGNGTPDEDPDHDQHITQINLRFPGQYADAETGLFYNLHRYYDPEKGRYTQSDPLGLADGTNTYAYVHSNPLSGTDPLGLYNAYTHFYMTYFLAITSGIPEETALKIALATQYVDENGPTQPTSAAGFGNDALSKYHFTLDYGTGYHGDGQDDADNRFYMPSSSQLSRLYGITKKSTLEKMWREANPDIPDCEPVDDEDVDDARYQFYGEYLHAYEDTFAHRDMNNMAYDKWSFNDRNQPHADIGHVNIVQAMFGSDSWEYPDQTFNSTDNAIEQSCTKAGAGPHSTGPQTRHDLDAAGCSAWGGSYTAAASWQYNELRTLRMEYEVFAKLQGDFGAEIAANQSNGGKAATWNDLAGTNGWDENAARVGSNPLTAGQFASAGITSVLQQFNAAGNADKYDVLNTWLVGHGYGEMPRLAVTKNAGTIKEESELKGTDYFNQAQTNRTDFLKWIPQQTSATSGVNSGTGSTEGTHVTQTEFGVILPQQSNGDIWSNNNASVSNTSSTSTVGSP